MIGGVPVGGVVPVRSGAATCVRHHEQARWTELNQRLEGLEWALGKR
jgi:hypothetical protein